MKVVIVGNGHHDHKVLCVMAMACGEKFVLPDLPPVPHHPSDIFVFPNRPFGRKAVVWRSCQGSWFKQWSFIMMRLRM